MEFLHSFLTLHFAGNQWWRLERWAVFSGLFYRPSTQSFCQFLNIIIKKKSQQSIFKMFQTVQVLDTLERQWSFKTEESYTFYIGNFSSHLNLCIKHHASWHPKNSWDVQKTTLWKFTAKDSYRDKNFCERFAPRSHFKSWLSLMVWVNVVLNRTVVVDNDWRFDNLCGSHRQSQIKETKTKFLLIQSTLALRTPRYNGHPDNTDCS